MFWCHIYYTLSNFSSILFFRGSINHAKVKWDAMAVYKASMGCCSNNGFFHFSEFTISGIQVCNVKASMGCYHDVGFCFLKQKMS